MLAAGDKLSSQLQRDNCVSTTMQGENNLLLIFQLKWQGSWDMGAESSKVEGPTWEIRNGSGSVEDTNNLECFPLEAVKWRSDDKQR